MYAEFAREAEKVSQKIQARKQKITAQKELINSVTQ